MSYNYVCPHCEGFLRANSKVILSAEQSDGKKGLILLSPLLGNYEVIVHEAFMLRKGDELKIFCPVCHADLQATKLDKHLAKILMFDEFDNEFELYFSEVVGEHATFQICNDEIRSYGEDADSYINHFGEMSTGY